MLKKPGILILVLVGLCAEGLSQQLSHQVIVPLAGLASDSKITYSQTVGETAVEIVGCSWYVFTQGFQQPLIKKHEEFNEITDLKVYPNPAKDFLTIELAWEEALTFSIDIMNITGNMVYSDRKVFVDQFWFRESIDIKHLIRGTYLVRIVSNEIMMNRVFKIEKM